MIKPLVSKYDPIPYIPCICPVPLSKYHAFYFIKILAIFKVYKTKKDGMKKESTREFNAGCLRGSEEMYCLRAVVEE